MAKMSGPCGLETEEKRITSICREEDCCVQENAELRSAKEEMGEVKEENERLKMMADRVEKDYQSLQLRFFDILREEASKKGASNSATSHDEIEEPELVSLCLGRSPRETREDGRTGNSSKPEESEDQEDCLTLGLDSKCKPSLEVVSDLSPLNSSREPKEAEAEKTWPTNKSLKAKNGENENSEQMPSKRARVSVRARCDTPTMHDGCQWRKYGQKTAKGNPCPRAYYRCTVAPSCPVRKQVQRCAEDTSILITTYEGTHNHPLPVSATAMASTTSAAASMLLSGSATSQPTRHSSTLFGNAPTLLSGLNFGRFDQAREKQVFFHDSVSSPLFPTIILDLTSATSSSSTHVNNCLSSNFDLSPRLPQASLSFCSPEPNIPPAAWGNGILYNDKTHMGPVNLGNQIQEYFYQNCMKNQAPSREALAEILTKAISTDESLRSAIAAAVSSIVGQRSTYVNQLGGEMSGLGLNLKLREHSHFPSSNPFNQNDKGSFTSHFNRLSSNACNGNC